MWFHDSFSFFETDSLFNYFLFKNIEKQESSFDNSLQIQKHKANLKRPPILKLLLKSYNFCTL